MASGHNELWQPSIAKVRFRITNRDDLVTLTLPLPGREIHVLVGSEKGVSSVPGRENHVYQGGSESDHFSLTKSAFIDIFCRQISPLAAQ